MRNWLVFTPLGVLLALGVLFAGWSLKRDPHVRPDALVGRPVPAIVAPTLAGRAPVSLKAAAHGPVLINVFFSTCAPCREEHPELLRLKAQGVRIIGVAWKEDPSKTRAFLDELGDPFETVLVDRDGAMGIELGVSGAPETYVVNSKGVIVDKWAEPMTAQDADRLAKRLRDAG
jgi:cytochrome c biogenesis protein CcmG/thiol:disulfide interchange protein DsbE